MGIGIASWRWDGAEECIQSWTEKGSRVYQTAFVYNERILPAYQAIFEAAKGADILFYVHDDVICHEQDWDLRVLKEFEDQEVGMVGFAGAPGYCHPDLYAVPFSHLAMGRVGFKSNMRNWRQHGAFFNGTCDVSVVDGFAFAIRRDLLEKVGGWPVDSPLGYYLYTEWLCCEVKRQGKRIRLVGVDCDHLNGKTSSIANITDDFMEAHRFLYEHNRDVLPMISREQ